MASQHSKRLAGKEKWGRGGERNGEGGREGVREGGIETKRQRMRIYAHIYSHVCVLLHLRLFPSSYKIQLQRLHSDNSI